MAAINNDNPERVRNVISDQAIAMERDAIVSLEESADRQDAVADLLEHVQTDGADDLLRDVAAQGASEARHRAAQARGNAVAARQRLESAGVTPY
jgi:hypothetical protein